LQVSTNGLISFQSPYSSHIPNQFTSTFGNIVIVAPFWADFNPSANGAVFYRTTSEELVLNQAAEMITSIDKNFSSYHPTLAIVATWYRVPLFGGGSNRVRLAPYYTLLLD